MPAAGSGSGSSWVQRGLNIEADTVSNPGSSVSISSDGYTVAIGSSKEHGNGINSGHVRIYDWSGSAWVQRGLDLDGEAAGDRSGSPIAITNNGNTVAIGAQRNDGNGEDSGHVRIYDWN